MSYATYNDVDPALTVTLPESDEDSMDDLSEGFKDDLNGEIFYPSGASVGKEGFDE